MVGGRRWARLLARELDSILDRSDTIVVNAPISEVEVGHWPSRAHIVNGLQEAANVALRDSGGQPWAIIANSAYLHATTAMQLLEMGFNVFSEKPLGFSRLETQTLINTARGLGAEVLESATLRFSPSLQQLKTRFLRDLSVNTVTIIWSDGRSESRHGEVKSFDSTTPLIFDVLPHVASILTELFGEQDSVFRQIQVSKGGRAVRVDYLYGTVPLEIHLARQEDKRVRILQLDGSEFSLKLDFASDPGLVYETSRAGVSRHNLEVSKAGSVAQMLAALNRWRQFGIKDARLSTDSVSVGSELIDLAADPYVTQQIAYLESHRQSRQSSENGLVYALREANAISTRATRFLHVDSPLKRLVEFYESFPHEAERSNDG